MINQPFNYFKQPTPTIQNNSEENKPTIQKPYVGILTPLLAKNKTISEDIAKRRLENPRIRLDFKKDDKFFNNIDNKLSLMLGGLGLISLGKILMKKK